MDDKEKLKEILELVEGFENSWMYGSNSDTSVNKMRNILEEIKKILEK